MASASLARLGWRTINGDAGDHQIPKAKMKERASVPRHAPRNVLVPSSRGSLGTWPRSIRGVAENDAPPRRPRRVRWDVALVVVAAFLLAVHLIGDMVARWERAARTAANVDGPRQAGWADFLGLYVWIYGPWVEAAAFALLIAAIVVRLRTRER